jgi:DNA-directed RNA polymerase subunit H
MLFSPLKSYSLSMHILQPKHAILKSEDVKRLLSDFNASLSQLPKVKADDPAVPEGAIPGDVLKIERKDENKITVYFRVVA